MSAFARFTAHAALTTTAVRRRPLWARVLTALLAAGVLWLVWPLLGWALWQAVWVPDEAACRAALGHGACWGVVAEKFRPILLGRYPHDEQWRPVVAMAAIATMALITGRRTLWQDSRLRAAIVPAWLLVLAGCVAVLAGGFAGLVHVPTSQWGGLPLTLLLTVVAMGIGLPLGVGLALARHSSAPVARVLAATYIELVRGVPLVTILFMASFLVPLLLPPGWQLDIVPRVALALTLFGAAYLAEVVRGGLQAVPQGQIEAATALGLRPWQVQQSVVLPIALRAALPAMMNSFIGMLKDTSLVTVVSLYELTGALSLALAGDTRWRSFYLEGYLFIALVYWVMCFGLSHWSRRLEQPR